MRCPENGFGSLVAEAVGSCGCSSQSAGTNHCRSLRPVQAQPRHLRAGRPETDGSRILALARCDPETETVSLVLDGTANIALFAIAVHADKREAHVREVDASAEPARRLIRPPQPPGHRHPRIVLRWVVDSMLKTLKEAQGLIGSASVWYGVHEVDRFDEGLRCEDVYAPAAQCRPELGEVA